MPDTMTPPAGPRPAGVHRARRASRRWRPGLLTIASSLLALVGLSVLLYPSAASWMSSYNQSLLIEDMGRSLENASPGVDEQLSLAQRYNEALSTGVNLDANANVPTGSGTSSDASLRYEDMLNTGSSDVMARVRIPAIDVDLPIYHGTSDETLLRGVGHLEGSSLPIGGADTHSVLTAHRGLAQAEMFTNLDKVDVGDRFTIEVFGEVLTYQVRETKVVDPDDTDTLHAVAGEDLVTLVTCTPLGINSQRILVTGERVTPTPIEDVQAAGQAPDIPGFPWWALIFGAGLLLIATYFWRSGYGDARRAAARKR
ncbi:MULTISPECIES: class C sortase [Glutamicibacter]|uniref:Sortase n=1 Tax=Glutamicibacter arilaitensis (strain DSM 16368 / CIP 108037 / IAM 15318 / JCM 13566 / NCIMB 14258 / Re117) TaxID=861360 RepID=A0ABM9PTD7_GLUAR|nr:MULTISPECIES: class C sortase [Glutamicibacter]CBT74508.1 putative sortase [Glutamicibacter arilaitensis Re117]